MYDRTSFEKLTPAEIAALVREMHAALVGLLWQIEDMKNHDEFLYESHFDDTVPLHRAQQIHRILMTRQPRTIIDRKYLEEGAKEFSNWWQRCDINASFVGAEKLSD